MQEALHVCMGCMDSLRSVVSGPLPLRKYVTGKEVVAVAGLIHKLVISPPDEMLHCSTHWSALHAMDTARSEAGGHAQGRMSQVGCGGGATHHCSLHVAVVGHVGGRIVVAVVSGLSGARGV
jgi:hypothetical protein